MASKRFGWGLKGFEKMVYKTLGIIIKKKDLKDADRLLTIYAKDFGKILVKAKAIKKSSAKLKGHLELFVLSYLMIAQGKNLDIITNAETIENFSNLRRNLKSLACAYYFLELIDKLIAGPEKDTKIWQLLFDSFSKLNQRSVSYDLLTKAFEIKLLEYLGYDLRLKDKGQEPENFIRHILDEKVNSKKFINVLEY